MQAAVMFESPGSLKITDIEIDSPLEHEVLIDVAASGLCHSDLHYLEGKRSTPLPAVLGHEAAGVVRAVGPGVTYVQPGDHVVTCLSTFCGVCPMCMQGRPVLCDREGVNRRDDQPPRLSLDGKRVEQFLRLSAFAEQMLVHENSLVKIRKDMPLTPAALVGCAVTTGIGAVVNTATVPTGSTVAIIGCGGVGLNAVQGAALAGASKVIAIDRLAWKLELAREFGATDIVDASEEDAVAAVREMTGGRGVDYAFEAIGLKSTTEQAFSMIGKGGTAVLIGVMAEGVKIEVPGGDLMGDEKRLIGSNMGSNHFRLDIPRYIDLYLDGRLKLDQLISREISLDQINEGYEALNRGETARSVIVF